MFEYYLITDGEFFAVKRVGPERTKVEKYGSLWKNQITVKVPGEQEYFTESISMYGGGLYENLYENWTSSPRSALWMSKERAVGIINEHKRKFEQEARRLKALAGRP